MVQLPHRTAQHRAALVAAGLAPAEVVVATVTSNGVVKFSSTGSVAPVSPALQSGHCSAQATNSTPGDSFGEDGDRLR